MFKRFIADYFKFSKKERAGIFVIIFLILFFLALPFFYPYILPQKIYDHKDFEKEVSELSNKKLDSSNNNEDNNYQSFYQPSEKEYPYKASKAALFYFDPNTLPFDGWLKLGIKEKTAKTIQNYLSKGGKFYKPDDIAKIWGMHKEDVKRLVPFVKIPPKPVNQFTDSKNAEPVKYTEKPKTSIGRVEINTADTSAFIALPGIGSKLANRIVSFREKLGGFYSIEQVAETFALPDSTFQKIKHWLTINSSTIKQVNINNASVDEMKQHPYLRYNLANAIVQYRVQHGNFSSLDEIKKITLITDEIFAKTAPYLTIR